MGLFRPLVLGLGGKQVPSSATWSGASTVRPRHPTLAASPVSGRQSARQEATSDQSGPESELDSEQEVHQGACLLPAVLLLAILPLATDGVLQRKRRQQQVAGPSRRPD